MASTRTPRLGVERGGGLGVRGFGKTMATQKGRRPGPAKTIPEKRGNPRHDLGAINQLVV